MKRGILAALFMLATSLSSPDFAKEHLQQPGPMRPDRHGEKWARETLKKMTLEQKVGQMFMIWSKAQFLNADSADYLKLRDTMRQYHLGGFGLTVRFEDGYLYKSEPLEAATLVNRLQSDSEIPLLFAADFERGLGYRLSGPTSFPHAMAFGATGDLEFARQSGRITAQEARAIGVQWNWFPDADVNSNPANPIINTRSFGEDPRQVGEFVKAYIEGAHEYGMLTTAKHFPGHGDTDTDSHLAVPNVTGDRAHLDTIELPPFRAAIAAGVDAVMVAHITVPALDPDPHRVASISPAIVSGLLQHDMGFRGLVVTDAMDMNGLMSLFPEGGPAASAQAAVAAVKAGDDVLIIPRDLDGAYNGVLQAVRSGEIPESRIDASVLKILRAKASVGLDRSKLVDLAAVDRILATPASLSKAQQIADRAVTLVRDNGKVLPLKATAAGTKPPPLAYPSTAEVHNRTVVLIFTEDSHSDLGRALEHEMRLRIPDARIMYIDPHSAPGMTAPVRDAVQQAEKVIAAMYAAPVPGKPAASGAGLASQSAHAQITPAALLAGVLQQAAAKTAVVAMGNPYLASDFPEIQTYICTYSTAPVSELSAVKALFGEIPMSGHLPVSIPGIAARGAGSSVQLPHGGSQ